jgi:hypothetical protein
MKKMFELDSIYLDSSSIKGHIEAVIEADEAKTEEDKK